MKKADMESAINCLTFEVSAEVHSVIKRMDTLVMTLNRVDLTLEQRYDVLTQIKQIRDKLAAVEEYIDFTDLSDLMEKDGDEL